jgi:hypothetical protein
MVWGWSDMRNRTELPSSFRDPSGFLFEDEGVLCRQINRGYQPDFDHLIESGLYARLTGEGLLIRHRQSDRKPLHPEDAYRVIEPERVGFVSYPYEWCFSQLKHAALTTLGIQRIALEHGMCLKDSSAYNIQFHNGKPTLIDSLSFEIYRPGKPWVAYRQYCQHFLAPLALMAMSDVRLGQLMRFHIDGLPLDLTSRLLPWHSRLRPSLLIHIHLHAGAQRRFAGREVGSAVGKRSMSKTAMMGLIDSLHSTTERLSWCSKGTAWRDYERIHNYTPRAFQHKQTLVAEFLGSLHPHMVWDLGANTGRFSRIASSLGAHVVAFDIDPGAVELNYQECRRTADTHVLPLLINLTNPSPDQGWANRERISLLSRAPADAALALALIHHLAIGNNLPLSKLASFLDKACQDLIIEFVPKEDPQVQRLLASREDIFSEYSREGFERAFQPYFSIERAEQLQESPRWLYLMRGRSRPR